MKLIKDQWPALASYIFFDRKIDSNSTTEIKSRYLLIVKYLQEYNLEFNRSSMTSFMAYKKERGCKNSYLNNIIKVAKYINGYVLQTTGTDPGCSDITYFKRERHLVEILTPNEIESIYSLEYPYPRLSRERNIYYQTFLSILALTGMRVGEVLQIKWADITTEVIRINDTKTDRGRMIPSNTIINRNLDKFKKYFPDTNGYVFSSKDQKTYADKTLFNLDLSRRVKYLGIKKRVWFHLFRHSFCVELLKRNDVTIVAKILGHENLSSTLGYSSYLLEDMTSAIMTHSLLRQNQSFDDVKKQLNKYLDNLVDKTRNSVHIIDKDNEFTIRLKQK